jgi:hypothetical protein
MRITWQFSILCAVLLSAAVAAPAAPQGRLVETWDSGQPGATWDSGRQWGAVKASRKHQHRRAIKY